MILSGMTSFGPPKITLHQHFTYQDIAEISRYHSPGNPRTHLNLKLVGLS